MKCLFFQLLSQPAVSCSFDETDALHNVWRSCAALLSIRRDQMRLWLHTASRKGHTALNDSISRSFTQACLDEAAGAADAARGFKWGNRLTVAVFLWVTRRSL